MDYGGAKFLMEPNQSFLSLIEEALPMLEAVWGPNDPRLAYCLFKISMRRANSSAPDSLSPLVRSLDLLLAGLPNIKPRLKVFGAWLPTIVFRWERIIENDYNLLARLHEKSAALIELFKGHEDSSLVEPWSAFLRDSAAYWADVAQFNAAPKEIALLRQDGILEAQSKREKATEAIKKIVFAWTAAFRAGEAPIFDRKNCQPLLRAPGITRQPSLFPIPSNSEGWVSEYLGSYKFGAFSSDGKVSYGNFFSQLTGVVSASGQWKMGKLDGEAKILFADGSHYQGHVRNGVFEGAGELRTADGLLRGRFSGGKPDGAFLFTPPSGPGTAEVVEDRVYRAGERVFQPAFVFFSSPELADGRGA